MQIPQAQFSEPFGITPMKGLTIIRWQPGRWISWDFPHFIIKWFTSPAMCYKFGVCMGYTLIGKDPYCKYTHGYSCLEFAFTANFLPVTINEGPDRYGFVRVKTWAPAIRAKHHFLSGSWVQVDGTNLPPCLHQSMCKMLVNSATAFPNIAKMIPQQKGFPWNILNYGFILDGSDSQPRGSATEFSTRIPWT
jgi:hypothetical protein